MIESFLGTLRNTVLTKIRLAMRMYLLPPYIQFMGKLGLGLQQNLRLLQLNLFERRDLNTLPRCDPTEPGISPIQTRL